jgi:hypothetical protein
LLREARTADNVGAALFVTAGGGIKYLAADHRSAAPYNTVQAIFDDDGTDLHYLDCQLEFSESFLFNDWNVTLEGGEVASSSDP